MKYTAALSGVTTLGRTRDLGSTLNMSVRLEVNKVISRPDYKFLGVMKTLFPDVPIIGLTATSTARVTDDCQKMLALKKCLVFRAPFNRPNIFYEVMRFSATYH